MKNPIGFFQSSKIDFCGLMDWKIEAESAKYPDAIFIKCRCNSLNPLAILRANRDQLEAAIIGEIETWNHADLEWSARDRDSILSSLQMLGPSGFEVKYIQQLDKKTGLMVFCFDKKGTHEPQSAMPHLYAKILRR